MPSILPKSSDKMEAKAYTLRKKRDDTKHSNADGKLLSEGSIIRLAC